MKNHLKLLFMACVLFLSSCSDESINPVSSTDIQPNTKEHLCLDAIVPEDLLENPKLTTYGALSKSVKWENGQTITIKFLNGNAFLQNKVKQFANQWMQYANLKFVYVNANQNADIRINFDNSNGSWSYLGTDSKLIHQSRPSMNFGWFNNSTPDSEFSRTVIHEFGHALGLIHEHQNPAANIQWNKPKVYSRYAGAPNYWSQSQVDENIINKYSSTVTNYSSFDSQSIMLYSFPASLTLNGWSSGWNTVLSATDKNFIAQQYPKNNSVTADFVKMSANVSSISFYLNFHEDTNFKINWGDGKIQSYSVKKDTWTSFSHSYSKRALYNITFNGSMYALKGLNLHRTEINTLDISKSSRLNWLRIAYTNLKTVDLSKNTEFTDLYAGESSITQLNFSNNSQLKSVILHTSPIAYNKSALLNMVNSMPYKTGVKGEIFLTNQSMVGAIKSVANTKNWEVVNEIYNRP